MRDDLDACDWSQVMVACFHAVELWLKEYLDRSIVKEEANEFKPDLEILGTASELSGSMQRRSLSRVAEKVNISMQICRYIRKSITSKTPHKLKRNRPRTSS